MPGVQRPAPTSLAAALRAVECNLASANMPTLDATQFECARGLRCVDAALGKGLLQIVMVIAQMRRPSWRLTSHAAQADKASAGLRTPGTLPRARHARRLH